jgi:hypothetical protein
MTGLLALGGVLTNPAPASAAALDAPASATAIAGRRAVKVTWTAPASGTVGRYRATAGTQTCDLIGPSFPGSLTCTVSNLDPNVTYTATVIACPNTDVNVTTDCSGPTSANPVKTGPPATPNAPTVTYTGANQNSMHLSWVAADEGAGIAYYRVTSSPAFSAETGTCTAVQVVVTNCDVANLTAGVSYSFRLTAVGVNNATGTTGSSALGAASPQKYVGVPAQPDAPMVVRTSNSEAKVSWTKPSGGAAIGGYLVQKTTGGQTTDACTVGASVTSCDVAGLNPAASYTFTVKANGEGDAGVGGSSTTSGASDPITLGKPNTPDAPTVELGATAGKVRVYWTAPELGGGTVTGYVVTAYSSGANPSPCEVGPTVTSCDFSGLATDGTAYTFKVVAKGEANAVNSDASTASDPIVSQLPDKPNTPTAALVANTPGAVTVTWAAKGTGGPVIFYTVTVLGDAQTGTPSNDCGFNLATPSCTITGLNPAGTYTFKVKAYGDLGWVESDASTSIVPNKPGVPTTAAVALDSPTAATVTWAAPGAGTGGEVTSYSVTATPSDGTTAPAACTKLANVTPTCSFTGLTATKTYAFKVTALNAAGNSTEAPATVRPQDVPGAPQTVAVALRASTPNTVDVNWTAESTLKANRYVVTAVSTDGGAPVTPCVDTVPNLTCPFAGLDTTKHYTFTARAENILDGTSATPITGVVPDKALAPTGVAVSVPAANEATVTWSAPNGGGAVATYTVSGTSPSGGTPPTDCTVTMPDTMSCHFTNLDPGESYAFTVKATNAAGFTSAPTTDTILASAPGAPTITQAVLGDGPGKVTVTWTAPTGAPVTGYTVTGTSGDGGSTQTCTPTTVPLSCTVSGLTTTAHYTFVVRATNLVGGTNSASYPNTPIIPDQPGAPGSVTADRGNLPGRATVNWAAPGSGGAVATYTVTATPTDGSTAVVGCNAVSSGTTTCAFTTLTAAKSYTFTVRADNLAGHGDTSTTTPLQPDKPDKPANVLVSVPTPGSATVIWDAPTGAPVTGGWTVSTDCTVTQNASRTCTLTGLTQAANYTVTVTAHNAAGDTPSDPIGPIVASNPNAPGIPTGQVLSATQVRLTWTEPSAGGGPVAKYSAKAYTAAAPTVAIDSTPCTNVTVLTCDFDGLSTSETYTFRVIALGPGGGSATGGRSTPFTTALPAKPAAPTVALEGNAVRVTWTEPGGGGPIVSYSVTSSPDVSAPARCTNVRVLNCLFDRLNGGTPYTFKVIANGTAGRPVESDASASITPPVVATTPGAAGMPGAPSVEVVDAAKVRLAWTAPTGGGPVTAYTVSAYTAGAANTPISSTPCTTVTAPTCEFDGLSAAETYTFRVTAKGPGGDTQGDRSPAVTTAGPGKPAAPTVLLSGPRAVTVTWVAPGGGPVVSYSVISVPDVSAPARCTNVKALSCVFDRLVGDTAYTFAVVANGTADRSIASDASISITTAAAVPAAPAAPTAEITAADKVRLTWTAPTGGGPITKYTVRAYAASASGVAILVSACTDVTGLTCDFGGLSAAETYTFRVTASGSGGDMQGDVSRAVNMAGPGKPSTPSAELFGPNAVKVTWAAPQGGGQITSYSVTATPDVSSPARCTNVLVTSCVFDRLRSGTEYRFTVVANGTADRTTPSEFSNSIIPGPAGPVAAPKAEAASSTSVKVSWTTPTTGGVLTGYQVQSDPSSDGCSTIGKDATSCVVSGLTSAASYTFKVKSVGATGGGDSDWSPASAAIVPGAPTPPTDVAVAAGNGVISVSWTLPANTTGIMKYRAQTSPASNICETATNIDTECVIPVTQDLAFYTVTVTAVGDGVSATSLPSQRVRPTAGRPGSPTGVTVTGTAAGAEVKWALPAWTGNGIVRYIASATADNGSRQVCVAAGSAATSCTIPGLTNGDTYSVTVVSVGRAATGYSDPSTPVSFTPRMAPGTPTNLAVNVATAKTLKITWTAGTAGDGVAGYTATATPVNGGTPLTCTATTVAAGATATCTLSTVTPGPYLVTVVARGTTGVPNSAPSTGGMVTVLNALAPVIGTAVPTGSPTTLTVSTATPTTGSTIKVGGSGFAPYTTINLAIIGSTTSLGTVVTDASGAFSNQSVVIPSGTGAKTLAAIGLPPTGTTLRYQTAALQVSAG